MKQFHLVNDILHLLKQGEQSIESLRTLIDKPVSDPQIRRAIEAIRKMNIGIAIQEKTERANKKTWSIINSEHNENTKILLQGVIPRVFTNRRTSTIEAIVGQSTDLIESSHFYETEAYENLDKKLEYILKAIKSQNKLQIVGLNGDATSAAKYVVHPIIVCPVKLIYHRGCFYVAAVEDHTQHVLTFQVEQLSINNCNESFRRTDLLPIVDKNLKTRFGISQNIDDDVYTIQLKFSSVTGEFVKKQFWHDDLPNPVQDGDNWLFTFECGINRELVGWLFQWMSNVKVLGPPKLVDLYNEQLDSMLKLRHHADNDPLEYTNRFAPKV